MWQWAGEETGELCLKVSSHSGHAGLTWLRLGLLEIIQNSKVLLKDTFIYPLRKYERATVAAIKE